MTMVAITVFILLTLILSEMISPLTSQQQSSACSQTDIRGALILKLMDQVEEMRIQMSRIREQMALTSKTEHVSFFAYLDQNVDTTGTRKTILFNRVVTNDGNAYEPTTGVFTCPVAGMYEFSYHIGQRSDTEGVKQAWTWLYVDDEIVAGTGVETFRHYEDNSGGNTAIVRLVKGSKVKVVLRESGFHVSGNNQRWTTFSGKYLYE